MGALQERIEAERLRANAVQNEYQKKRRASDPKFKSKTYLTNRAWQYGMKYHELVAFLTPRTNCAICNKYLESLTERHVDHDHETGAVRDVLCVTCNTALGKFNDNPELLRRAADYLEKW